MPLKKSDMLPGFNHNIKHNGRIFHVQTEDSGVSSPHIITHLFVGGNILATKKTSYADIITADNLSRVVRELMEEQHKAMLRNLVNGVYDGLEEQLASAPQAPVAAPVLVAPQAAPSPPRVIRPIASPPPAARAAPPAAGPVRMTKFPPAAPVARPQPARPAQRAPTLLGMPSAAGVIGTKIYPTPPAEAVPSPAKAASRVTIRPGTSLPQPPAEPLREIPPEVLAARRLVEKPSPKDTSGPTIFGEDLISEKSLDEVILGYLAGDGEDSS